MALNKTGAGVATLVFAAHLPQKPADLTTAGWMEAVNSTLTTYHAHLLPEVPPDTLLYAMSHAHELAMDNREGPLAAIRAAYAVLRKELDTA